MKTKKLISFSILSLIILSCLIIHLASGCTNKNSTAYNTTNTIPKKNTEEFNNETLQQLGYVIDTENQVITKDGNIIKNLDIPANYTYKDKNFKVTKIGSLSNLQNVKDLTITLPESVTIIEKDTFKNYTFLKEIKIPDSVIKIEDSAFEGCTALKGINIPSSVTTIGSNAFKGCASLKEIKISNSVTKIENSTFEFCTDLEGIKIPDGVTTIGDNAFFNCTSLKEIKIPDSITKIGYEAFEFCTALGEINIPKNITKIEDRLFANCTALKKITIPDSVTTIGDSAFEGCTSLEWIKIPNSVTSIGEKTFANTKLTSNNIKYTGEAFGFPWGAKEIIRVTLDKDVLRQLGYGIEENDNIFLPEMTLTKNNGEEIVRELNIPETYKYNGEIYTITGIKESLFRGNKYLEKVIIPNSVDIIPKETFYRCKNLEEVIIGNNVTRIGEDAFYNTKLISITLPNSVTRIEKSAFSSCSSLEDVQMGNNLKRIGENAFYACPKLKVLIIPDSVTTIEESAFEPGLFQEGMHIYYNGSAKGSPWGAKAVN